MAPDFSPDLVTPTMITNIEQNGDGWLSEWPEYHGTPRQTDAYSRARDPARLESIGPGA